MIGNVLYGVVASSGALAGGTQPATSALVFVDEATLPDSHSGQTGSVDLTFDEAGIYIVAAYGQAGNSFGDNELDIDSIGSFTIEEVYRFTNDEFETIRFVKIDVTAAGIYTVTMSNGDSNGIYRAGAACWRLEGPLADAPLQGYRIDGSNSNAIDYFENDTMIAVALGRDNSPSDLSENSLTGLSRTDKDFSLLDSVDDFYYKLMSEERFTGSGTATITHTPGGNTDRAECGILFIQGSLKYPDFLRNPGAEDGMNHWNTLNGDFSSVASEYGLSAAYDGTYFFFGGSGTAGDEMWQLVSVPASMRSVVQNGDGRLEVTYQQASGDNADRGRLIVTFYDESDTLLSTITEPWALGGNAAWEKQSHLLTIPNDTNYYEFRIEAERLNGSNVNAYFDDFQVSVIDVNDLQTLLRVDMQRAYAVTQIYATDKESLDFQTFYAVTET